jgi:hypothetical protein
MCVQEPCVYLLWPPSVVIGNSLFITGRWKTTWTWIKETGRKPNGREEKRTNQGHCYANQVVTRIHANQGHCYANQVVTRIHSKLKSCQSCWTKVGKKGSGTKRAFMQTGRIYTENRILGLYGKAQENGRKKENCKKTDKDQELEQGDSIPR